LCHRGRQEAPGGRQARRTARWRRRAWPSRSGEITSRRVECTINEFGDRADNAAPGVFVMALAATRQDFSSLTNNIETERPCPMSRKVSTVTGLKARRTRRSSARTPSTTRLASTGTGC
jgi:hypothetical protein